MGNGKIFFAILFAAVAFGCTTMIGSESYIPIGPQNLSVRIQEKDASKMPVYTQRNDIKRPWAPIGLVRIQNLPNDGKAIMGAIERIKKFAAKKGAQAVIINQYVENAEPSSYPVTMGGYLVKFLDDLTDSDAKTIENYVKIAEMQVKSATE